MSRKRRGAAAKSIKSGTTSVQDLKQLLSVGSLIGAVMLVLILGAVWKVDASSAALQPTRTLIESATPDSLPTEIGDDLLEQSLPAARPAPENLRGPADENALQADVDLRALDDQARLASVGREWTLQFMVTGRPESALGVLQRLGDDSRLYLLPMVLNGEPCFRICWGTYRTRDAAISTLDIPAQLLGLNPEPLPRQISDLVR